MQIEQSRVDAIFDRLFTLLLKITSGKTTAYSTSVWGMAHEAVPTSSALWVSNQPGFSNYNEAFLSHF